MFIPKFRGLVQSTVFALCPLVAACTASSQPLTQHPRISESGLKVQVNGERPAECKPLGRVSAELPETIDGPPFGDAQTVLRNETARRNGNYVEMLPLLQSGRVVLFRRLGNSAWIASGDAFRCEVPAPVAKPTAPEIPEAPPSPKAPDDPR